MIFNNISKKKQILILFFLISVLFCRITATPAQGNSSTTRNSLENNREKVVTKSPGNTQGIYLIDNAEKTKKNSPQSSANSVNKYNFLQSIYFKDFCIPLLALFFTTYAKATSRKQPGRYFFKKEDLLVGVDLTATSLILFTTKFFDLQTTSSRLNEAIQSRMYISPWISFILFFIFFAGIDALRRFGWYTPSSPGTMELRIPAIVLADIAGLVSLVFVVKWFGI